MNQLTRLLAPLVQWSGWVVLLFMERVFSLPLISLAVLWWWSSQWPSDYQRWVAWVVSGTALAIAYQLPLAVGIAIVLSMMGGMVVGKQLVRHDTLRLLALCLIMGSLVGLVAQWAWSQWPWRGIGVSLLGVFGLSRWVLITSQRSSAPAARRLSIGLRFRS